MRRIKTIDGEVAGEAVRLIVGGGPSVPGRTMAEKLSWLRKNGEALRQLLMLEPRGHRGMHGALLTEPVSPNAHAGLLSMHAAGFPLLSGEGIIAAVTLALENGVIQGDFEELLIDTPPGLIRSRPRYEPGAEASAIRVSSVALTGIPSFVHSPGLTVQIGTRRVAVDIAFGGEFYAIADSEAIGVPVDMSHEAALIRMGREIKEAVEAAVHVRHPTDSGVKGLHGAIFTGVSRAAADLRSATVLQGEVLRRSPGATGTAALLAVLDAMGLIADGQPFTHEGILGTVLYGNVLSRQTVGDVQTITPLIEGSATATGFHEFVNR
ncbi:MAG: proline racemase [Acidobacteria bacterium]|nr:MAG: proline racemase [Acidobacteriota bacterium]